MLKEIDKKFGRAGERTVILQDESLRKLKGFVQIPKIVLMHQKLSYGAKVSYGVLLGYAWQDDFCFPAQESIAKDLNCSVRQVQRLLTELKTAALVSWKQQGLNRPNTYYLLPLKLETDQKTSKILDTTDVSHPDTTDVSRLDRTNMSYKEESKLLYTKPFNVRNGDKKISTKSKLKILPELDQPKEKTQYVAEEILSKLGDRHSERFYYLVASRIPEPIIRNALSEIKTDGAENPARVFTYRMESYAKEKSETGLEV